MLIRLLRTYLQRYKRELLLVLILQTAQTFAALYLPSLNADIIDKGVAQGDTGYIWSTGGLMLLITLVQVMCAATAVYFGAKAAMGFGRDVRSGIFHQVSDFSAREIGKFGAPSLITRITNDVQQVQMLVLMTCTLLVAAPITAIGGIVMAIREDTGLSWILTVSIPVLVICVLSVVSKMVPQFRKMQERIDVVNRVLREQITGIRVVRAFVRERAEAERFADVNEALTDTALRAGRLQAFFFPIVMLVLNVERCGAVVRRGPDQRRQDTDRRADRLPQLPGPDHHGRDDGHVHGHPRARPRCVPNASSRCSTRHRRSCAPKHPSRNCTRRPPRTARRRLPLPRRRSTGAVQHLVGRRPGQVTAIIGSTGSGKTTLLSLVPRLFDVTSGSVLVDGVDVRDIDPDVLWGRIGLVPQKPYLFSGTIASNLRFADPDATDEQLWAALDIAQASDFVRAMPGGLQATIAQGGSSVSGGQRQCLAIARALVRRPGIYLFDDSFSALDLCTDARLRAALGPHTADATVLIVAQRVSTIIHADQILVLEDGESVGLGTHAELLETCPTYREIVESQMTAEEAA
jgi:ATP-binding cassette subfamily B protein